LKIGHTNVQTCSKKHYEPHPELDKGLTWSKKKIRKKTRKKSHFVLNN